MSRVAVISGGRSSEHEVSLRSGEAVARGLEQAGHEAVRVTISAEGRWTADGEELALTPGPRPARRRRRLPGPARPLRRGRQRPGPARVARPPLRRLRRPLLGDLHGQADPEAALRRAAGFPRSSSSRSARRAGASAVAELGTPLWVKPSRLGSSVGISRVEGARRRARRRGRAGPPPRPAGDRRGIRRGPRGRVLAARQRARSRPRRRARSSPTAIGTTTRPSTGRAGWSWSCRRRSPRSRRERLRELAVEAFRLGGCSGLARCDFFVEPDGAVLVNEINTMPGFTETSVYAKLWEAAGLAYPDLCDRLDRPRGRAPHARPLPRVLSVAAAPRRYLTIVKAARLGRRRRRVATSA